MEEQKIKKDIFLPISVVIAAIVIGGAVIYSNGMKKNNAVPTTTPSVNAKELTLASDLHIQGDVNAKLIMYEFSDFECPYCSRFDVLARPDIYSNYIATGKMKAVFMDYPLPFHEYAQKSAEAAWCAGDQNKYWEMYDTLFAKQESSDAEDVLSVENIKIYAKELGLNVTQFNDCLDSNKYQARVEAGLTIGSSIGISGTPTVVIAKKSTIKIDPDYIASELEKGNYTIALDDGVMIVGAQAFSNYQSEIEKLLK